MNFVNLFNKLFPRCFQECQVKQILRNQITQFLLIFGALITIRILVKPTDCFLYQMIIVGFIVGLYNTLHQLHKKYTDRLL